MAELAYTVTEVAEKLSISADTVYRLIREGRFPAYRTGAGKKSGIRIPCAALDRHLTDVALANVRPAPQEPPMPDLQAKPGNRRTNIKTNVKHWYDIPGCGGRKRKQGGR